MCGPQCFEKMLDLKIFVMLDLNLSYGYSFKNNILQF